MKTIQFTDEEIQSMILIGGTKSAFTKLKLAKSMPDGSTLSDDALLFYVTPSEAVEEVCDRRKAAREENEKRVSKQMISKLEKKCERLEKEIEDINNQVSFC